MRISGRLIEIREVERKYKLKWNRQLYREGFEQEAFIEN